MLEHLAGEDNGGDHHVLVVPDLPCHIADLPADLGIAAIKHDTYVEIRIVVCIAACA